MSSPFCTLILAVFCNIITVTSFISVQLHENKNYIIFVGLYKLKVYHFLFGVF